MRRLLPSSLSLSSWSSPLAGIRRRLTKLGRIGATVVLVLAGYGVFMVGGAVWISHVDDDIEFIGTAPPPGGSRAVALTAALIDREIEVNGWTANTPPFLPSVLLDDMPEFQMGMISALSRFAIEMADQLGRSRGSSNEDTDLAGAAGLLAYPGDRWYVDFRSGLSVTPASHEQYRQARSALLAYNARVASGEAVFEARSDNLLFALNRIAGDLGGASARIDEHIATKSGGFLISLDSDNLFYANKGRLYAYLLLLRELSRDFDAVISERQLGTVWRDLLRSLQAAVEMRPLSVVDGSPDGQLFPNHLAVQGFYLLRARTKLRELTDILRN